MSVLHKTVVYLCENILVKENTLGSNISRTVNERSLTVEQICETATNRGESDMSIALLEHAVELFLKEMTYQLCNGYSVNAKHFTSTSLRDEKINGTDTSDSFNFDKHAILFLFNREKKSQQGIPNIEIQGVFDIPAFIGLITDVESRTVNDLLTPGKKLKITGNKIKIAGKNIANGIFFINTATHVQTPVKDSDIIINSTSKLMIVIPPVLTAGTYTLEIVTQYYTANVLLKEPYTVVLNKILTVK